MIETEIIDFFDFVLVKLREVHYILHLLIQPLYVHETCRLEDIHNTYT